MAAKGIFGKAKRKDRRRFLEIFSELEDWVAYLSHSSTKGRVVARSKAPHLQEFEKLVKQDIFSPRLQAKSIDLVRMLNEVEEKFDSPKEFHKAVVRAEAQFKKAGKLVR